MNGHDAEDPINPARGMLAGLAFSLVLWAGLLWCLYFLVRWVRG